MDGNETQSIDLFTNVFTNLPIGMFVIEDGLFRFINPQFQRDTAYREDELIGKDSLTLVFPEDRGEVRQKVIGMLKGGPSASFELRIVNKAGEVRWAVESVTSILYQGRRAVLGYFMDITERKRLEERLASSEERYRDLYDHAPEMYVSVDPETAKIIQCNQTLATITGYTKEEIIGRPIFDMYHPDCTEEVKIAFQRFVEKGEVSDAELQLRRKDGTKLEVSLNVSAVRDEQGKILHSRSAWRDNSYRKETQRLLATQAEELARSNAELEQFAYLASHDLQEPLRMVASYTQLLQRRYQGKLDADADEFISYAVDGADRMQRLINDLLNYSRVATHDVEMKPVDCETVLNEALSNLEAAINESGAKVTHERLPTVVGDATQLTQLFQNLVGNAIKFRGTEPPVVHVSSESTGDASQICIQDNGVGIEPRFAECIFQAFQRLHSQSAYPGTGIGLALCQKIVERHGGRIWVEPNQGKGSKFWFTLPVRQEPGAASS